MDTRLLVSDTPEWDQTVVQVLSRFDNRPGGGNAMKAGICDNGSVYREIICYGMGEYIGLISDLAEAGFVETVVGRQHVNGYDLLFEPAPNGIGTIAPLPE